MNESLRVVIADDHPAARAGVRAALEHHGFEVCAEVATGPAAVEAAVEHRPDLCLLDVHMPGGGLAAAAEIGSALPETAVVMLTVSPDDEYLFGALEAGARGYLLKDIPVSRLPEALAAVIHGELALPRAFVSRLVEEFQRREPSGLRRVVRGRSPLTSRELEVLELMRDNLSTKQIALRLRISQVTVRRHIGSIVGKLGVTTRAAAVEQLAHAGRPETFD